MLLLFWFWEAFLLHRQWDCVAPTTYRTSRCPHPCAYVVIAFALSTRYRFRCLACYGCEPLIDIYDKLDNGTLNRMAYPDVCLPQLLNHLTTNLQPTWPEQSEEVTTITMLRAANVLWMTDCMYIGNPCIKVLRAGLSIDGNNLFLGCTGAAGWG